jgi:hypothetical protein
MLVGILSATVKVPTVAQVVDKTADFLVSASVNIQTWVCILLTLHPFYRKRES